MIVLQQPFLNVQLHRIAMPNNFDNQAFTISVFRCFESCSKIIIFLQFQERNNH